MKRIIMLVTLGVAASSAAGQSIVSFTFGTSAAPTTLPAFTAPNLTASAFTGRLGSPGTSSSSPGSATAGGSGGSYFSANMFRSSDGNYFQFSVTPAAGYQMTLSSMSFNYLATSSGPTTATLTSSANNYGASLATTSLTRAPTTPVAADWHLASSSLTLTFTAETTFRIAASGASGSTGGFRIDDFGFSGSVSAIPEPSTYAAISGAVALLGAGWWRRRHPRPPAPRP